ncbi:MAG: hypothetical protein LUE19_06735 [Clostridiales bacterium]|nr:hypothetical protein [Clostridiales bacterium]
MKMKMTACLLASLLGMGMVMTGCGSSAEDSEISISEESAPEETEVSYQTIGNESEDAYSILLTNQMGSTITGLSVRSSEETDYPADMMKSDQQIEDGETVVFFYLPDDAGTDLSEESGTDEATDTISEETSETQSDDTDGADDSTSDLADVRINITYFLQVTEEDGTVYELSYFAIDDMDEVVLCYEDDVAYLEYTSLSENIDISTKEAELAVKADRETAQAVVEQIDAVGEVTLDSEEAIQTARAAYDALTDSQKLLVTNADLLTQQENELAALKQQAAEEAAAAQAASTGSSSGSSGSSGSSSSSTGSSSGSSSSSTGSSSGSSSSSSGSSSSSADSSSSSADSSSGSSDSSSGTSDSSSSDSSSGSQSTEGCLDDVIINQ